MKKAVVTKGTTFRSRPAVRTKPAKSADKNDSPKGFQIRSASNALDLLEAICGWDDNSVNCDDELYITQLSRQLGLSKSTIFSLLATFENRGYVEREKQSGFYRIGMNAYEVGRKLLLRMPLLHEARPVSEDLCRHCNEAVYLAVRRGNDFLLIDLVESAQQVKVTSLLGKRFPLMSAAPGQLMLAFSGQLNMAPTVPDCKLQSIRQAGYCADQNGLGELISCLAAPIFDKGGTMVGAVCLVSPSFRMLKQQIETSFLPSLKDASEVISAKLGYFKHHMGRIGL